MDIVAKNEPWAWRATAAAHLLDAQDTPGSWMYAGCRDFTTSPATAELAQQGVSIVSGDFPLRSQVASTFHQRSGFGWG